MNKRDLVTKLAMYDTSDILEVLAEETERTAKELIEGMDQQAIYNALHVWRQRNLVLRLLACEFLDIGD
jgi:Fe2+ or Zn2+ uptake regulation protein